MNFLENQLHVIKNALLKDPGNARLVLLREKIEKAICTHKKLKMPAVNNISLFSLNEAFPFSFLIGDTCEALSIYDNKWHIGRILSLEKDAATVLFKESGVAEHCKFDNLRTVQNDHTFKLPESNINQKIFHKNKRKKPKSKIFKPSNDTNSQNQTEWNAFQQALKK